MMTMMMWIGYRESGRFLINHEYCGEVGMSPSRFKFRLLKYDGFNFIVSQPFLALSLHFAIMHI